MNVLLLSPYPEKLLPIIDEPVTVSIDPLSSETEADLIISYGYRHIIKEPHLKKFGGRLINLHISYLPWNRGADPNFWSWYDDTPKGVTIHHVDGGIDTGDIIAQAITEMASGQTLASSYETLQKAMIKLFAVQWPLIRSGRAYSTSQTGTGSYHRKREMDRFTLPEGWNTPTSTVQAWGRMERSGRG